MGATEPLPETPTYLCVQAPVSAVREFEERSEGVRENRRTWAQAVWHAAHETNGAPSNYACLSSAFRQQWKQCIDHHLSRTLPGQMTADCGVTTDVVESRWELAHLEKPSRLTEAWR